MGFSANVEHNFQVKKWFVFQNYILGGGGGGQKRCFAQNSYFEDKIMFSNVEYFQICLYVSFNQ